MITQKNIAEMKVSHHNIVQLAIAINGKFKDQLKRGVSKFLHCNCTINIVTVSYSQSLIGSNIHVHTVDFT